MTALVIAIGWGLLGFILGGAMSRVAFYERRDDEWRDDR